MIYLLAYLNLLAVAIVPAECERQTRYRASPPSTHREPRLRNGGHFLGPESSPSVRASLRILHSLIATAALCSGRPGNASVSKQTSASPARSRALCTCGAAVVFPIATTSVGSLAAARRDALNDDADRALGVLLVTDHGLRAPDELVNRLPTAPTSPSSAFAINASASASSSGSRMPSNRRRRSSRSERSCACLVRPPRRRSVSGSQPPRRTRGAVHAIRAHVSKERFQEGAWPVRAVAKPCSKQRKRSLAPSKKARQV
jgi:hypothetical protein